MQPRTRSFTVSSRLAAPASEVWASVSTIEGVNFELGPFLKMTCPSPQVRLDAQEVPVGVKLFRSWVLFLGWIPLDYDDLRLIRIEPGVGFLEESSMLSQRMWRHERTIEPEQRRTGCVVTDVVSFIPRWPLRPFGRLLQGIVMAVFRWRHRRLKERFGTIPLS